MENEKNKEYNLANRTIFWCVRVLVESDYELRLVVCSFLRIEQLGTQWTAFHKI
jgi:hypothetical protein